jgi:hypothetical protein
MTRTSLAASTLLATAAWLMGGCFSPSPVLDTEATSGDPSGTSGDDAGASGDDDDDGPGMLEDGTSDDGMPDDDGGTPDASTGTEGGMSDDDTTTASADGGAACDGALDCVPEVPAGWSGPAAVYRGAEAPPACPAAFPELAITAGTEIAAPPAECGCECGEASGFQCSVTVTESGEECGFLVFDPDQWTIDSGECQLVDTAANAFSAGSPSLDPSGGSCAPAANESIAEAAWGVNVQACLARAGGSCEGGTCVGALDDSHDRMCIYTGGDVACPNEDYADREVVYSTFTDTRDCSSCTCGTPSGTCGGTVSYVSGCAGLATLYGSDQVPGCGEASSEPNALRYTATPDVECSPSGGAPTGDVTPTGAITVCCSP